MYLKAMLLKDFCMPRPMPRFVPRFMPRRIVSLAGLLFLLFSGLAYTPVALARGSVSTEADPFAIPRGLEPAVEFWKAIFLDHDSTKLVFFDPQNMSKIHRVVKVREGARVRRLIRSVHAQLVGRGIPSHRIKVQRGISDRFAAGVRRSGRYRVHMREIFAARGLPLELTRLPLVESSFRNDARSFRGAVGMWQFMPGTGRLYMRVTRLLDERKDPLEATRAAARLLQDNYRALGTWPLAVTAYNHGRAGMRRAVRQLGTRDIVTIIRRYRGRTFKFASKNFYAEFLAAVHIMRDVERLLPHVRFDRPLHIEEISLPRRVAVSSLLRRSGVSRAEFLKWNPALSRRASWVPAGYRLKAPRLQSEGLRNALAGMGPSQSFPYHVVSRGETLSELAKVYGTSADLIQSLNGLRSPRLLQVGQRLEIPSRTSGKRATVAKQRRVYHRVRWGETLSGLAKVYGTSADLIQSLNGLRSPRLLQVGQRLEIPSRTSGKRATVAKQRRVYHRVRRGETLSGLAKVYGTSADLIQSLNGLRSPRLLQVGQRLEIPSRTSGKRATVAKQRRVYHRVRRGETLSAIADRYRVSPAAIQRANAIRNRHRIRAGQRLRIPVTRS